MHGSVCAENNEGDKGWRELNTIQVLTNMLMASLIKSLCYLLAN